MKKLGGDKLKSEVSELSREVQKQLRRTYWQYTNSLFVSDDDKKSPNRKKFYTYVKHLRNTSSGVPPLKSNGKLYSEPKEKAEILNNQFNKAFSDGKEYDFDAFKRKCTMTDDSTNYPSMKDIEISKADVEKLLANLDPSKATGPDGISPRILRELSKEIAPILTIIFQRSLSTGLVPHDWKEALVTPVYKKGEHYNPVNYRPISLTCVSCKLMEHILVSNIMDHLEENNILCAQQHGFRKKLSCETQLLEFMEELSENLEKGNRTQTDVIVMDFAKAFDRVNHSLLVHKLNHFGIRNSTNQWISAFLHGRSQTVVVEGAKSNPIPVRSGVPQGSVLGPCLFLIYINDLSSRVSSLTRLFADDTILYRFVAAATDHNILQDDLKKLELWESEWDMSFHPDKCSVILVTKKKEATHHQYILYGHTLDHVSSAKYLGVTGKRRDAGTEVIYINEE